MIDLYADVLRDGRSPERVDALMQLVELLYASGYDDTLDDIMVYVSTSDSITDIVPPIESLILKASRSFTQRIGLTISDEHLYGKPIEVYEILTAVLEVIENYDDVDSMLAIVDSGDPATLVVSDLIGFVLDKNCYRYVDVIEDVSVQLMRVIRNMLIARQIQQNTETMSDDQAECAMRVSKYLLRYPNSHASTILDDNAYLQPSAELIKAIDLDPVETPNYLEELALCIGAIIIAEHTDLEEASAKIEPMVALLVDPTYEDKQLVLIKAILKAIQPIYEEVQEEVDVAVEEYRSASFE